VKEIKEKYGQNIDEMALLIKYPYYLPKDTQFNFIPHIFLPSRKHNWMDNVVLSSIIKKMEQDQQQKMDQHYMLNLILKILNYIIKHFNIELQII